MKKKPYLKFKNLFYFITKITTIGTFFINLYCTEVIWAAKETAQLRALAFAERNGRQGQQLTMFNAFDLGQYLDDLYNQVIDPELSATSVIAPGLLLTRMCRLIIAANSDNFSKTRVILQDKSPFDKREMQLAKQGLANFTRGGFNADGLRAFIERANGPLDEVWRQVINDLRRLAQAPVRPLFLEDNEKKFILAAAFMSLPEAKKESREKACALLLSKLPFDIVMRRFGYTPTEGFLQDCVALYLRNFSYLERFGDRQNALLEMFRQRLGELLNQYFGPGDSALKTCGWKTPILKRLLGEADISVEKLRRHGITDTEIRYMAAMFLAMDGDFEGALEVIASEGSSLESALADVGLKLDSESIRRIIFSYYNTHRASQDKRHSDFVSSRRALIGSIRSYAEQLEFRYFTYEGLQSAFAALREKERDLKRFAHLAPVEAGIDQTMLAANMRVLQAASSQKKAYVIVDRNGRMIASPDRLYQRGDLLVRLEMTDAGEIAPTRITSANPILRELSFVQAMQRNALLALTEHNRLITEGHARLRDLAYKSPADTQI